MKFKENAIKPGMVIHCPKEEDARVLLEYLDSLGYRWGMTHKNLVKTPCWNTYTNKTCYMIEDNKTVLYGYSPMETEITEFSDLIEPETLSGKEVIEWFAKADCHVLAKTFGGWRDVDDILRQFTANEILDKITAYEASKKEKPVELEWVNVCKVYRTDVEYGDQVLLMKKELPDGGRKIPAENLLKEAITIYGKDCYATVERRCRVKGGA